MLDGRPYKKNWIDRSPPTEEKELVLALGVPKVRMELVLKICHPARVCLRDMRITTVIRQRHDRGERQGSARFL